MKKAPNLTQQKFDDLLAWLSPDRDAAGDVYISVCEGLNRFFRIRGCSDTPALVDETINRVARKLETIDKPLDYKPLTYFYGFAKNVYFEYRDELTRAPLQFDSKIFNRGSTELIVHLDSDPRFKCMDDCVDGLGPDESSLVLTYFENDRIERIHARRDLAERLQVSMGGLHVRIHRLKENLRECIENCLQNAKSL